MHINKLLREFEDDINSIINETDYDYSQYDDYGMDDEQDDFIEDDKPISMDDVIQLKNTSNAFFKKVGIDICFDKGHFLHRINAIRNGKHIKLSELINLYKKEFKKYGKLLSKLPQGYEAVLKDLQTNINVPFVLKWDDENKEMDLVAKTAMRTKNFITRNKVFAVEHKRK